MGNEFYVCEGCGQRVEHGAAGVVAARRRVETPGLRPQWIDGMGVHFHAECFPSGTTRYRLIED